MFRANSDVAEVEMFPGVVRRTLNSGVRTTLAEITLANGSIVPSHTHVHEQIGYVARGRVLFNIDGDQLELEQGDSYLVPSSAPHEVTALEDSICIDVFSPVREEFL
jgi:quercetin dioxygenase-like cupin family protein